MTISIEHLRNVKRHITQAKAQAKEVFNTIVMEDSSAGTVALNSLIEADARAKAAYIIMDALEEAELAGRNEVDKETAEFLLKRLEYRARNSIYEYAHEQTIWMLNDYASWLRGVIASPGN